MNEHLGFVWGRVIAILALIAVAYTSFVGFTYMTNGDFIAAGIGTGIILLVYVVFFFGAQEMKATEKKFRRRIVWERVLIIGSPVVFLIGMIPVSHFWTVRAQNDEIVKQFNSSINGAKQLFTDYETYADNRMAAYEENLNHAGSADGMEQYQKENRLTTLRLQLLSDNYSSLKKEATGWIDEANQGASTLNVFLLGNTREIKKAINDWYAQLRNFSDKRLSNEGIAGEVSSFSSQGAKIAISGIDGLTDAFTTPKSPNLAAYIFAIITYLMLLFPYFLQERHSKSIYRLIGTEKSKRHRHVSEEQPENFEIESKPNVYTLKQEKENDYPIF